MIITALSTFVIMHTDSVYASDGLYVSSAGRPLASSYRDKSVIICNWYILCLWSSRLHQLELMVYMRVAGNPFHEIKFTSSVSACDLVASQFLQMLCITLYEEEGAS